MSLGKIQAAGNPISADYFIRPGCSGEQVNTFTPSLPSCPLTDRKLPECSLVGETCTTFDLYRLLLLQRTEDSLLGLHKASFKLAGQICTNGKPRLRSSFIYQANLEKWEHGLWHGPQSCMDPLGSTIGWKTLMKTNHSHAFNWHGCIIKGCSTVVAQGQKFPIIFLVERI